MKTCIIMEIKNDKAVVLFPDGKFGEIHAKPGWEAGQTISVNDTRIIGRRKMRAGIGAVACLFLVMMVAAPFALNWQDKDTVSNISADNIIGDPSVIASEVEYADDDYSNILKLFKDNFQRDDQYYSEDSVVDGSNGSQKPAVPVPSSQENNTAISDKNGEDDGFSGTNIQVEGVQEADIVKTDGEYIYAINSKNLVILQDVNNEPKVVSKIEQKESEGTYFEMYVEEGRLTALKNTEDESVEIVQRTVTQVDIFDISDPGKPKKIKSLSQSGSYSDSRMVNGYLYLISEFSPSYTDASKDIPESYLPRYALNGEAEIIEPRDLITCNADDYPLYTVIGSIDTQSSDGYADKKTILSNSATVYASPENIYLASYTNDRLTTSQNGITAQNDTTQLFKLNFNNGKLGSVKSAKIPGLVTGQFCMDEHDGVFRVVTETYWDGSSKTKPEGLIEDENYDVYDDEYYIYGNYTAVFTLDMNLKPLGKIVGVAPEENLYSCRFIDDYVYFVTFRQVDPLFTADLSDPEDPELVGKLKIPGFSEYMHPYDDGLLFGIGNDADENSGAVGDLKLSMFDNSDPENIREKHTLILKGYGYTEVSYNHKAILVDSSRKLIAFPADAAYLVYTYDEKTGFRKVAEMNYNNDASQNEYLNTANSVRGLYIGNKFYIITPNFLNSFDLNNDFTAVDTLRINRNAEPVLNNDYNYTIID